MQRRGILALYARVEISFTVGVDTTNIFNHNTKHTNRRRTMPEISVINDGKAIKFGDSKEDAAQSLTKLKHQDKVF